MTNYILMRKNLYVLYFRIFHYVDISVCCIQKSWGKINTLKCNELKILFLTVTKVKWKRCTLNPIEQVKLCAQVLWKCFTVRHQLKIRKRYSYITYCVLKSMIFEKVADSNYSKITFSLLNYFVLLPQGC